MRCGSVMCGTRMNTEYLIITHSPLYAQIIASHLSPVVTSPAIYFHKFIIISDLHLFVIFNRYTSGRSAIED